MRPVRAHLAVRIAVQGGGVSGYGTGGRLGGVRGDRDSAEGVGTAARE